jgi:dephospho-CoA kinase
MFKLGLTGSIATGKSTVLKAFAALGIPTFSADAAVHALYEGAAVAPLAKLFPTVVHNGKVDRAALSRHLLAHPAALPSLEAVVHPLVRREIAGFLAAAEAKGARLAVVDVPLLFESGYDYGFDAVATTWVDAATQRRRALARPGMTVEKLDAILARQLPQAEKKRRADYAFDTGVSIRVTEAEVKVLVDRLAPND